MKGIASKLPSETDGEEKEAREERAREREEGGLRVGRRRREESIQPSTRHPIVPLPTFRTQRQFTGGLEEDIG